MLHIQPIHHFSLLTTHNTLGYLLLYGMGTWKEMDITIYLLRYDALTTCATTFCYDFIIMLDQQWMSDRGYCGIRLMSYDFRDNMECTSQNLRPLRCFIDVL